MILNDDQKEIISAIALIQGILQAIEENDQRSIESLKYHMKNFINKNKIDILNNT